MPRTRTRDDFLRRTKEELAKRVAYHCSNPECDRITVGPDRSDEAASQSVGIASHICAASEGGARFDPLQTTQQRSSIENGIWLCGDCARIIDAHGGANYSKDILHQWKKAAELRADRALMEKRQATELPTFFQNMHYLQYVNLPRLARYVTSDDDAHFLRSLHTGYPQDAFSQENLRIDRIIQRLNIQSISYNKGIIFQSDLVGTMFFMDECFYTRNCPASCHDFDIAIVKKFDKKNSPHIYINHHEFKIICPYNPKYITGSTASCDFHGGRRNFSGLLVMKHYDAENKVIIMSPLILGIQYKNGIREFYDSIHTR